MEEDIKIKERMDKTSKVINQYFPFIILGMFLVFLKNVIPDLLFWISCIIGFIIYFLYKRKKSKNI
jgi:hypothetical protein